MLAGSAPDSMIDETKAANSGGHQPLCGDSSVWMKSRPWKGWPALSMRPYMWVPETLQGWRWMVALASTIASLSPFLVTVTLSRGATATTANSAPLGFQHFVQPQAWLCADWVF